MKPIWLDQTGWEVCAHKHTPMGQLPNLDDIIEWPWKPAALPFDAISWLHDNGHGPDPMVGFNDVAYSWAEDVDWVLRKSFSLPNSFFDEDEEAYLKLQDIDCYFEVIINGQRIGSGTNQFRVHTFDIEEAVLKREEANELIIYIRSARNITTTLESAYGQLPAGFDTGRVHARRCQSITGWDWTPRLSSVSVLTPPALLHHSSIQLSNPYVVTPPLTNIEPGQETVDNVNLSITFDLQSRRRASGELTIRIRDLVTDRDVVQRVEPIEIKPKSITAKKAVDIQNPALWWPLGMGNQALYEITLELNVTDKLGLTHHLTDRVKFGIRHATIERQKDADGETFTPIVNGVPIFCRGANWIPVSVLASRATSDQYKILLNSAVASGMNCLRVWGGGIYETDEFYEICDHTGILVWQDFMFTCAAYPTYREFLDEVESETVYQVTRLRNHPSLLIWCGNNENEWLHQTGDLKKGNEQHIIGETIWAHLIRNIIEDLDPSRVYHQSSPFGKSKSDVNDQQSGDHHSWEAWSGWQSSDEYQLNRGRFITEFGFQALPVPETLAQFAPYANNFNHPDLLHHQKMIEGQERLIRYVAAHYNVPASLADWSETTQKMQAEVLRRAVEHWRRQRFHTSGCLIWQLHDAYTAVSWSLIDYYRRPKLAFTESCRFFAPVLLSMELQINGQEASAIPPEMWLGYKPSGESLFPTAGGDPLSCKAGTAPVQVKFTLINDTCFPMQGDVNVEFLADDNEPVILDSVYVAVGPNETAVPLTHDIGNSLLKDVCSLRVRAKFVPDEPSRNFLEKLGNRVRQSQHNLMVEDSFPVFNEWTGLELLQPLVEPKYLQN